MADVEGSAGHTPEKQESKLDDTVFCSGCSFKVRLEARYCWHCQCDLATARPPVPSSSTSSHAVASSGTFGRPQSTDETKKRRIVSLKEYINEKSSKQRGSQELRSKRKKINQREDLVTISIGIKKLADGMLKSVRGKRLPIRVAKSSTCKQVLAEGLDKWKKFDRCFDPSSSYSLVYEDGTNAQFLPGQTKHFFDVEKYQKEYGKDYKRIVLYLCETDDLLKNEDSFTNKSEQRHSKDQGLTTTLDSEFPLSSSTSGKSEISRTFDSSMLSTAATPSHKLQGSVSADKPVSQSYGNYMNLFDDEWEDDDDELAAAIAASIEDQNSHDGETSCGSTGKQVSIADAIGTFIVNNLQATNEEEFVSIVINRKDVLTTTLRAVQRNRFSFTKTVKVTFSGEDAVDNGGPKREYFRLLMLALQRMGVFQGKWFSHDLELLNTKKYEFAGKLIAWSILQGGPGPRCLAKEAFSIMKGQPDSFNLSIEAVGDEELKAILKDVDSCSTTEDFNNLIDNKSDMIARYGYSRIYTSDITKKDEIMLALLKQAFVFSVHAEMEQFWDGMNTIGKLGDLVKSSSDLLEALLCENPTKLHFAAFKSLYQVHFSPEGSNRRNSEEKTIYCFEAFLLDLDEGQVDNLCVEDMLVFITGADAVPPLGFDHKIVIAFYDQEGDTKRFPWSSTCSLTLSLPRGIGEPEEFSSLMSQALLNCQGFGKC